MQAFILKRLLSAIPVLLLVLVIIFSLVRLLPGDPAVTLLGPGATDQQVEELRRQLRLDRPVVAQFAGYLGGVLRGDLGESLRTRRSVAADVRAYLPATIELAVAALLIAVAVGVPLGVL